MPAWWKGGLKGKLKARSKSSPASEPNLSSRSDWPPPPPAAEEEKEDKVECSSLMHKHRVEGRKEKANSFDGVLVGRMGTETVSGGGGGEPASVFAFGHPLPLPSPATMGSDAVPASGSASASSLSSSGSSDCPPDLGFYRSSAAVNKTRGRHVSPEPNRHQHSEGRRRFSCSPVVEHPRSCESPLSPRKESLSTGPRFQDAIFNPKAVSFAPGSRGSPSSSSPMHPISLRVPPGSPSGRQDDLRSPPHPLPLPPTSSSSSSSSSSSALVSSFSHTRWKKGKLLGRGTFGHVYLGFNSENGQMCAIKEVKAISDDSISRESLKQLNQEVNLLSQLSHPNVVQYYGSELVGETLAVYLEYVSGGSIHKLLQEYGPFGESVIKNYTAQILCGLAYLHCRNTVHRDIKGANILVDPNGEVKLADFGMAKHISSYTSIKSFKGSPYWMAPEVIMNVSGYNLSVDIWSLGCTVLEMATSKPPWSQFEGVAAIFKIGNSKDIPDIPEHLSSEAKNFLRLCLLRDPSSRPTATQLMNHPFIYDQPAIKATKSSMRKDTFPSSSDGSYSKNKGFPSHRSASPLHEKDYGLGQQVAAPPIAHKNSSDIGMRMNMSLPVSRCTSPRRQFRQMNRSCLPSPTHPAFSAGASPCGLGTFSYRFDPSHNFPDPSFDVSDLGTQPQHHAPRR